MHGPLRQAHGEDGDGDGQYNCDNQHGDVVDNGLHQLVIAGTHLLYGSGKRAFGVGPPVKRVGEEREGEGNEAPADAFQRVVFAAVADDFGECSQCNDADKV